MARVQSVDDMALYLSLLVMPIKAHHSVWLQSVSPTYRSTLLLLILKPAAQAQVG